MKTLYQLFFILSFSLFLFSCRKQMELPMDAISVPIAGNTYVTAGKEGAKISNRGEITAWNQPDAVLSTWLKVSNTGQLNLFFQTEPVTSSSQLEVSLSGKTYTVKIEKKEDSLYPVGTFTVSQPGYLRIDVKGLKKESEQFPFITAYLISGSAAAEPLYFVRDFETYWGLRGPSVHMNYALPENDPAEYFYNEITVPISEDKIGSYFMTNGFAEGYCGIQVNSESERRVLFSVWSPFTTDNPEDIPKDQRIKTLARGEGVQIGEFGNEGSGGQSYLIYPWKAGETYKIITRVRPDGKGNTEYYAWFYAAEEEQWRLIAGFLRPQTDTWYKKAHSFLENFIPSQGYLSRKVYFGNQWIRTSKGDWIELIEGVFTHDATARAGVRMDYKGGVENDAFFLQNGGFFDDYTEYKSLFTRQPKGKRPDVDLEALPITTIK